MNIRLLGTGSAEGWPGLFCRCDICRKSREVRGKNLRTRSSALIDGVIKIDLPPDTLQHVHMQNLDLTTIDCLVITHGHADHIAIRELQYNAWMFVPDRNPMPLKMIATDDVCKRIRTELDLDSVKLKIDCIEAWETMAANSHQITAIKAHHEDIACFNYLISDSEKTLLYATDTGWYSDETWSFLSGRGVDGVVVECTKGLDENGYKAHLSIPEVIRFKARLEEIGGLKPGGPIVTTHHSHLSGLLHEDYERHLNPHGIQVGYDGMVFDLL